jgi:hypothetical protein
MMNTLKMTQLRLRKLNYMLKFGQKAKEFEADIIPNLSIQFIFYNLAKLKLKIIKSFKRSIHFLSWPFFIEIFIRFENKTKYPA